MALATRAHIGRKPGTSYPPTRSSRHRVKVLCTCCRYPGPVLWAMMVKLCSAHRAMSLSAGCLAAATRAAVLLGMSACSTSPPLARCTQLSAKHSAALRCLSRPSATLPVTSSLRADTTLPAQESLPKHALAASICAPALAMPGSEAPPPSSRALASCSTRPATLSAASALPMMLARTEGGCRTSGIKPERATIAASVPAPNLRAAASCSAGDRPGVVVACVVLTMVVVPSLPTRRTAPTFPAAAHWMQSSKMFSWMSLDTCDRR
mmetsp:Transcript_11981/g.32757  ORF Transcript_11981/g.32757 Transcript_11981/m.32757 type:complete len:265 (-) Transcript_11981:1087-1881(-)